MRDKTWGPKLGTLSVRYELRPHAHAWRFRERNVLGLSLTLDENGFLLVQTTDGLVTVQTGGLRDPSVTPGRDRI